MGQRNLNRRRGARGQAVVELVLGSIVFVTILIFGIHFAEVGYLSVKVTEAQHSAIFDATGATLHRWPKDASPANGAVSTAASQARSRYQDFDSRSSSGGSASISQVFTQAQNFNVTCRIGEGPGYTQGITKGAFGDNKGVSCQASAQVRGTGIAQRFLDSGDIFKPQHYTPITIGVCGMGRGNCAQRKLIMLLDDWGLASGTAAESKNCKMTMDSPGCENTPFWDMSEAVYKANGGGIGPAGSALVMGILKVPSPINERQFWMSASKTESSFGQKISPTEGLKQFNTTPHEAHYKDSYQKRKNCWLGLKCP